MRWEKGGFQQTGEAGEGSRNRDTTTKLHQAPVTPSVWSHHKAGTGSRKKQKRAGAAGPRRALNSELRYLGPALSQKQGSSGLFKVSDRSWGVLWKDHYGDREPNASAGSRGDPSGSRCNCPGER